MVALRRQIAEERARGLRGKRSYSASLKRRVMSLARQEDWGPARVCRELELASSVLYRWSRQAEAEPKVRRPGRQRAKLTKVEIVSDPAPARSFELEFACGAKVTGLSLADLARLLGGDR